MNSEHSDYAPVDNDDARRVPVRVALVQDEARFTVAADDEPKAMSMPHLFLSDRFQEEGRPSNTVVAMDVACQ